MGKGTEPKETFSEVVLNKKNLIEQIDYLHKHGEFKNYEKKITLAQYRFYINWKIKNAVVGAYDPYNEKPIGINEYSIDDGNLRFAHAMWGMTVQELKHHNISLQTPDLWKHLPSYRYKAVKKFILKALDQEKLPDKDQTDPSSFTVLSHNPWGFIHKDRTYYDPIIRGKGKVGGGFWALHERYVKFINNEFAVPESIIVYKNKVLKVSDKTKYFRDCKVIKFSELQKYRTTKLV